MIQILKELNKDDLFNIVTFESYSHPWSDTVRVANEHNVNEAIDFVKNLKAEGGKHTSHGTNLRLLRFNIT